MYCFVILLLFNEMQMSVRRFSAIPHLRVVNSPFTTTKLCRCSLARWLRKVGVVS